jgi:hypothetical protein
MPTHPLFWLAFLTVLCVAGFALWSLASTRRQMKHGANVRGIGGPNDPLS